MRSAVIVDAVRSPMGKGRAPRADRAGGQLSGVHPVELLSQVFTALIDRTGIDPGLVEDVVVGCVSQVGEQAATPGRWAWLAAGFPESVPAATIDRRCGSGQQAADYAAQAIIAGAYDVAVVGGIESMSRIPMGSGRLGQDVFGPSVQARYGADLVPQGVSAELIAAEYGISRAELDGYATNSHLRADACRKAGEFDSEIVPIHDNNGDIVATQDETIRPGTTVEDLGALPASFRNDDYAARWPQLSWSVTAGNSSQLADGAGAMLVVEESVARELGLHARARFVGFALAGADPVRMLTAPLPATEKVLKKTGLRIADLDHYEVNEAFASVPLAWLRHFEADRRLLNPRGGAIALGHPLGASGIRCMTTMLNALDATGGAYGLLTMCEGGGMANATIIKRL